MTASPAPLSPVIVVVDEVAQLRDAGPVDPQFAAIVAALVERGRAVIVAITPAAAAPGAVSLPEKET